MAVVLRYGFKPTQTTAMYPIFDSSSSCNNINHAQPKESISPTSDGVCDRSNHGSPHRSMMYLQEHPPQQDVIPSRPAPQTPGRVQSEYDACVDSSAAMIDPNSSRRKRRKIAPTSDGGGNNSDRDTEEETKPVEAHDDRQKLPVKIRSTQTTSISLPGSIQGTSKRGRPRKKQAPSENASTDTSNQQSIKKQSGTEAPLLFQVSTPKKKTMSIHTNGKLLSSPPTKIVVPKDAPAPNDNKSSSARNVKMKNGKLVQSLEVILKYGREGELRKTTGQKIETILSKPSGISHDASQGGDSKMHPFFLGKVKPKPQLADGISTHGENTDNENDVTAQRKEPVAWKDIKFSSQKPTIFKSAEVIPVIWPPLSLQHIGHKLLPSNSHISAPENPNKAKLKSTVVQLQSVENILDSFTSRVRTNIRRTDALVNPQKRRLKGIEVAHILNTECLTPSTHVAFSSVYSGLVFGSSAFDRGVCAGPNMWPIQYSPTSASAVLQPSAANLHEWLQNLAIHNVKSGIDASNSVKRSKGLGRKKRRKVKDELDDFIVDSEDEEVSGKSMKTAILLVGPNGCGKTASVFAVAKELGFEVFEIHPGMRRTAKDIFDRVGDMAHNHLVQKGSDLSRSSSVAPGDTETKIKSELDDKQTSATKTLKSKLKSRSKTQEQSLPNKAKREQKQSLILFEEVDVLFEDDKGFWSGVESLIQNSKRPVVLTCNDLSSVPVDNLDLYDVLTYNPVAPDLATDYLMYLAAAEGHILDRATLSALYASKGSDLRASITELNFWCQMTIGSKQGGLDWMGQNNSGQSSKEAVAPEIRVFSQGTFHKALDLLPQVNDNMEDAIRFAQDSLGIAASDWCDIATTEITNFFDDCTSPLDNLTRLADVADAQSVLDLLDNFAAPVLADTTVKMCHAQDMIIQRNSILSKYRCSLGRDALQNKDLVAAFEPLRVEKPTFPPSQGRLAPSIDFASATVATDVAPYVRCIVNFDKRLEQYRNGLPSSQGKARKTRAARAAAEGGDKASTRSERWLPKDTDFDKVLRTGGDWPAWYHQHDSNMASPSTSSEA